MLNPEQIPETEELPELLRFADGGEVKTPEDWERRREELLTLYSEYMYGYMPDRARETVTWTAEAAPELDGILLTVTVEVEGRNASFGVLAGLPSGEKPSGGFPFYMEYWPWHYRNWFTGEWVNGFSDNCRYAISRGYAGIQYDCSQVAQDNDSFTGAFYTLYPYSRTESAEQRGTLLAWAWGVSKVIDALEAGAGDHNNMIIHLDGHAVLRSDMEMILDYCDVRLRGASTDSIRSDLGRMKGNLFLQDNRDRLDRFFAPYLAE